MSRVVQIRAWNSTHAWQRGPARSLRSSTPTPCVRDTRCDFLRFSFVEVLGRESTLESLTRLTSMLQVPACTCTQCIHRYRYLCNLQTGYMWCQNDKPKSKQESGFLHTYIPKTPSAFDLSFFVQQFSDCYLPVFIGYSTSSPSVLISL